ncbi:helix-turn-helix transcriptional regulator [Phytoactinopolyspora mesophila]|uniref:WYL domain-containing protein n=1 Tax=Phytoactinopolyspora mesophila TaxID=2650750 RepID=A0A7K3LY25_9ACTN|nr:WYL domain-containing protein [Phytoactinopolyspora mesophila]NDL55929.1 WYL domain-containing protein [Phytoactinopolyspora mesophila]
MTDTPGRLLRLLSLLQTPREWPGSELAERLGVSPRTVRRDISRLRDLGYPVEATVGAAGGYTLVAGTAMPPLLLDDDEAVAIAVGLRTAAGNAVEGIEESSARALAKLEQVLPSRLRYRVRTLGAATMPMTGDEPAIDADALTVLAAAVANREKVRFTYRARDSSESSRLVEPLRLVSSGRRWYLVAFDNHRDGWRSFRVDRIHWPRAVGARTVRRELPAASAADYVAGRRTDWGTPIYHVAVTFQAPAASVAGRLGDAPGEIEALGEDRCRLAGDRDDSIDWLASRMLTLGCEFDVHGPPELAEALRAISARAARATSAHDSTR